MGRWASEVLGFKVEGDNVQDEAELRHGCGLGAIGDLVSAGHVPRQLEGWGLTDS